MKKTMMMKKQRGQGMTEYIVIVALIAVAAIATYQFFGQTIRTQTAGMAQEISGKDAKDTITAAQTNSAAALAEGNRKKSLANYNNNQ